MLLMWRCRSGRGLHMNDPMYGKTGLAEHVVETTTALSWSWVLGAKVQWEAHLIDVLIGEAGEHDGGHIHALPVIRGVAVLAGGVLDARHDAEALRTPKHVMSFKTMWYMQSRCYAAYIAG